MMTAATRRTQSAAAIFTACLLAAGCSSSKSASTNPPAQSSAISSSLRSGSAPTQTGPVAHTSITVKDFAYTVSGDAVAGSTVKITNNDGETHTVTADSGKAFDVTIKSGQTVTFTAPATAGTYKFRCSFHSDMHGTLTVSN